MRFHQERTSVKFLRSVDSSSLISPLLSFFIVFFLAIFPFFVPLEVKRIRIENISSISELVRKDILNFFDPNSGGKLKDIIYSVFSACEKSLWARSCQVDFALPDILVVRFDEILPRALLLDQDKVFIVSQYGEKIQTPILLHQIHENGLNNFPVPFLIIRSPSCSLKEISDFLNYLYEIRKGFADQVVCLDFSVEIYSREGYKIILPRDDMKRAFARFLNVESKIKEKGISEADFRGNDKVFVK
jgi:hypothetical protein